MKIGVTGYGSIGRRHISNLLSLGHNDITLFRTKGRGNENGLKECYSFEEFMQESYDFVLVTNPASCHLPTMRPLLERGIDFIVEKPSVSAAGEADTLESLLGKYTGKAMVAYNMRFHPCVVRMKQFLDEGAAGKAYSARFTVGQYLPDWRPGQDYSKGVSALRALGGGVVLELIHELDLALFMFGKPVSEIRSVAAKLSSLDIETEDIAEIIYMSESGTLISVHQDYLCRGYRRSAEIICEKGTIFCDMKDLTVSLSDEKGDIVLSEKIVFERNDMYLSLIKYFLSCLEKNIAPHPSLKESLDSVRMAFTVKEQNNL
jgi:predicted dehydrogenase